MYAALSRVEKVKHLAWPNVCWIVPLQRFVTVDGWLSCADLCANCCDGCPPAYHPELLEASPRTKQKSVAPILETVKVNFRIHRTHLKKKPEHLHSGVARACRLWLLFRSGDQNLRGSWGVSVADSVIPQLYCDDFAIESGIVAGVDPAGLVTTSEECAAHSRAPCRGSIMVEMVGQSLQE